MHSLPGFSLKSFFTYAAVAVSGTVLFFFLHYLGNQLPYELGKQRFETAFKENNLGRTHSPSLWVMYSETPYPITLLGGTRRFAQCQTSLMILRGGYTRTDVATPFLDAVLLKSFDRAPGAYCAALASVAVDGAELGDRLEKTRYWWGGKALHAVALRYFSVFEIREMTKTVTYFAYLLLAVFLLRFYPRTFLLFSPLIVFGFFFSGIRYFPGSADGLGHLWAVASAVVLVLLAGSRASSGSLRLFCFIAGMVSSYVWTLDGHTILIMTLIGSFIYFTSGEIKSAVACVGLYIVGFLACFMLGQLAKIVVYEWLISNPVLWSRFYDGTITYESGWVTEVLSKGMTGRAGRNYHRELGNLVGALDWESVRGFIYELLRVRNLHAFYTAGLDAHFTAGKVFTALSALALVGSTWFAAVQARRGRVKLFRDVTFIIGMLVFIWAQLFLQSDNIFSTGKYVFTLHALCWTSLILVVMERRRSRGLSPGKLQTR